MNHSASSHPVSRRWTVVLVAAALLPTAFFAQAGSLPSADKKSVYTTPLVKEITQSDRRRVEIDRATATELEKYLAAYRALDSLMQGETTQLEQLPEITERFADMESALTAVLGREGEVRGLFREQQTLVKKLVALAEKELLLKPAGHDEKTQREVERIQGVRRELAQELQRECSPLEKERLLTQFKHFTQLLRLKEASRASVESMRLVTARRAVQSLGQLLNRVYDEHLARVVGYRAMEQTRDHYRASVAVLASVKSAQDLQSELGKILGEQPGPGIDHLELQNETSGLLTRIVDAVLDRETGSLGLPPSPEDDSEWLQVARELAREKAPNAKPASKPVAPPATQSSTSSATQSTPSRG